MAGYIKEYLATNNDMTLFYQFQRTASDVQSTPTTFASSLILQLLGRATTLPSSVPLEQLQNLASQCPLGPQSCSFNAIWNITSSLMSSQSDYKLVIDAMDECLLEGQSIPEVSRFLDHIFKLMRDTHGKVLVFSRPEPRFNVHMAARLSILMDEGILLPDIMAFSRRRYDQLELPHTEKAVVMERIRGHSQGSFRWTRLFLDYLGRSLHISDFNTRLRTLPPSVGDLYKKALKESADRLDEDELHCRQAIFLMGFQAQRILKVAEVESALLLRPGQGEKIISDLCKPFITPQRGFLQLTHPSVREFFETLDGTNDSSFGISFSDADSVLAQACLSTLLDEENANLDRIGSYLKANYWKASINDDKRPSGGSFYNYASRFWDHHLTRVKSPSQDLLCQVKRFLLAPQFSFWAEYSQNDVGQFVVVVRALDRIKVWHGQLSEADKAYVPVDAYFRHAYHQLSATLEKNGDDQILQWLAKMSLGEYYFIVAVPQEARVVREQTSAGLQALLGPRHPLSLRARADVAYLQLYAGRMRAARRLYGELVDIQRETMGTDSISLWETLVYRGESEYFMADFATATITLTTASAELLRLAGPESWQYLGAQWWYAKCLAQLNQPDVALEIMQFVFQKRRDQFGTHDPFATVVQISIGEVLRLLGRHEASATHLEEAIAARRAEFDVSHMFRLDVEIALAASYHSAGRSQDAMVIIERLEGKVDFHGLFERACQVTRLKALLLAKEGSTNEAIQLLQNSLIQTEQDQHNRGLLWTRLDLADLLRHRNIEGDEDQASSIFDNIVRDASGDYEPGFPDEPDPPRLLAVAEKILRLVQARKLGEAGDELETERVNWARPSDLWLVLGGTDFAM